MLWDGKLYFTEFDWRNTGEKYSHKGHSEVEPLPQASEGDKGLSGETARGHLAVGLLVLPWWTLTQESTSETIHADATVLAHSGYTPAWWSIYLTVFTY